MSVKFTPMAVLTTFGLLVLPVAAFAYFVGVAFKKLFVGKKKVMQIKTKFVKPLRCVPYMHDSLGYGRSLKHMAHYLPRRLPHLR